jgi:hypothetical protein
MNWEVTSQVVMLVLLLAAYGGAAYWLGLDKGYERAWNDWCSQCPHRSERE